MSSLAGCFGADPWSPLHDCGPRNHLGKVMMMGPSGRQILRSRAGTSAHGGSRTRVRRSSGCCLVLRAGLLLHALALPLGSGRPQSRTFFLRGLSGIRTTASASVAKPQTPSRTTTCRDVDHRHAGGGGGLRPPRSAHGRLPQAAARASMPGLLRETAPSPSAESRRRRASFPASDWRVPAPLKVPLSEVIGARW